MGSCHHPTNGCCGSSALANNALLFSSTVNQKNLRMVVDYLLKAADMPLTPPTGNFLDASLTSLKDTSLAIDAKATALVKAAVTYAGALTEYTQLENSLSPQPTYDGNLKATATAFETFWTRQFTSVATEAEENGVLLCSSIGFMEEANVSGWVDLDYLLSCVQTLAVDNTTQLLLNLEGHYQRFVNQQAGSKRPARAVFDTTVCELDATYKLALVLDQYFTRLDNPADEQLTEYERDSLFTRTSRGPVGHIIGDAVRSRLRTKGWLYKPF